MSELGTWNWSIPSRKNGRFSGYDVALRGSDWTCCASAYTCEKSGVSMPDIFRVLLMPQRPLAPGFAFAVPYAQPVPGATACAPLTLVVNSGTASSTRPRERPVRPVSLPLWARNDAFARVARVQ